MAKRPQAKYAPGELDLVRKRLGNISKDEAQKMADLLGGEVGVEREDDELNKKYTKIKDHAYKERLYQKSGKKRRLSIDDQNYDSMKSGSEKYRSKAEAKHKRIGFFDRIKLDFLCSRPEFQIKEFSGALFSIFSFFLQIPDTLNPKFLKESDIIFYNSLSNFVLAVRKLFSKKNQPIYKEIKKHGYYTKILDTIKEWDINGINLELGSLKRLKSRQNITRLKKLTRMVYKPLMLFHEIDEEKDILEAIDHAYHINMQNTEDKGSNYNLIEQSYFEAKTNLNTVFYDIKRIFYPILLKFTSTRFFEYHDYFIHEFHNILNFLQITQDDLISPNKTYEAELSNSIDAPKNEEIKRKKNISIPKKTIDPAHIQAKNLLIKLFPKAGFDDLSKMPDLYAYFSVLFQFPDGFELIPPDDPFQQVVVLIYIINNLLFGFRHIKFGTIKNHNLENIFLQKKMDSFLSNWSTIIDEAVHNYYIIRLSDFCNQIDKDLKFAKSDSAFKLRNELKLIKKTYFLPFTEILLIKGMGSAITKKDIPKLFELTQEYVPIFSQITNELNQLIYKHKQALQSGEKLSLKDIKCTSIDNPWDKIKFDITNPVTNRLDQILINKITTPDKKTKIIDKRTNSQLIFYVDSLLSLLDFWINNPTSHLYQNIPNDVYRKNGVIPNHNIPKVNPYQYFNENIAQKNHANQVYSSNFKNTTQDQLIKYISSLLTASNKPGAYIQLIGFHEQGFEKTEYARLEDQIKKLFDRPGDNAFFINSDFYIISQDLDIQILFGILKRLLKNFSNQALIANTITFSKSSNINYTWKIFQKLQQLSREQNETKILYFEQIERKIKSFKINP